MKKWQVGLVIGMGLIFSIVLALRYFDKLAPINTSTKTCLVTGASSGIGKHLAIEMSKLGWKVIGVARRGELLDQLKNDLGDTAFIPFVCDVSDPQQVHNVSEQIKAQGLQPTLFFLNAGVGEVKKKWDISVAHHQQTFATNYFGVIAWIEEWLLPVKQLGGGTFVATSSVVAFLATPGSDAYVASKAALTHCFDAYRRQYLYDGIGFSLVFPGPVDTEMLKGQGTKRLPFKHSADDEARCIIEQTFAGNKKIEPSWFYALMARLINVLPDAVMVKFLVK